MKVSDDQAVGLQNQIIHWSLEADGAAMVTDLGQTISNSAGVATIDVNTELATGNYRITATLPAHEAVASIQTDWLIEAGEPTELLIAQIQSTRVGQPMTVSAVLLDIAGNETLANSPTLVDFRFVNTAGVEADFAFTGGNTSAEIDEGRVITKLTIDAQVGEVSALITAPQKVLKDSQWLEVGIATDALQASYDHDNNPTTPALTLSRIPLLVEPGSATDARFLTSNFAVVDATTQQLNSKLTYNYRLELLDLPVFSLPVAR